MNEPVIHAFGYPTVLDEAGTERYADTGEPVVHPSRRPCPKCHRLPTPDGHDPCLGHIEGAISACCGHGVADGFILWQPAEHSILETDAPRWLCWLLARVITGRKPAYIRLRFHYPN